MTTNVPLRHVSPTTTNAVGLLRAPTQIWGAPDGRVDAEAGDGLVHGVFHGDRRFVSRLVWQVPGQRLDLLAGDVLPDRADWTWAMRALDTTKDPRVLVRLTRRVEAGRVTDELRVHNATPAAALIEVRVGLRLESVPMAEVRAGAQQRSETLQQTRRPAGLRLTTRNRVLDLLLEGTAASSFDCVERPDGRHDVTAIWQVPMPPGASVSIRLGLGLTDQTLVVCPGSLPPASPREPTGRGELDRWLQRADQELSTLALATPDHPDDVFLAAGAPWYLTLFGRDSLWSALLLLRDRPGLAGGTLRALAARQARQVDQAASAAPGKILHELRAGAHEVPREGLAFPPIYYGSIDATLLWVRLLHDAWRGSGDGAVVTELLPSLRAAAHWLLEHADPDGDGLVEYQDLSGTGLSNQGWKDSSDSVRFHDGRIAKDPVALCEVQGYAYEAAIDATAMLAEHGSSRDVPLRTRLAAYADRLRTRFRETFWVNVDGRRYPAAALDGDKNVVDSLTSNIGHLVGTGLLDPDEEATVAALLVAPELSSGYGLRTLSVDCAGYWPVSYHCGSVWPHDTSIAIANLLRAGFPAEAQHLAGQLLALATRLQYRLPELVAGYDSTDRPNPVRYPTACAPQAWAAAAVVPVVEALRSGWPRDSGPSSPRELAGRMDD